MPVAISSAFCQTASESVRNSGDSGEIVGFALLGGIVDNPSPLFNEQLFVRLSRFCAVRYCIAQHVGFLTGLFSRWRLAVSGSDG
jgi:hypothetical protein